MNLLVTSDLRSRHPYPHSLDEKKRDDSPLAKMTFPALGPTSLESKTSLRERAAPLHVDAEMAPIGVHASSPSLNSLQASYEELVRRAKPEEMKAIESELSKITQGEAKTFADTFSKMNWDASKPQFTHPKTPLLALEAFRTGLLKKQQFATACLFFVALQRHEEAHKTDKCTTLPVSFPLIDRNGKPSADARMLIQSTLNVWWNKDRSVLNQDQLNHFFELCKELPESEKQFLIIGDCDQWGGHSISASLYFQRCINVFGCFSQDGIKIASLKKMIDENHDKLRMVPSAGMMQKFLQALNGEHAVEMNFVLGQSTLKDLYKNGLNGTRDYAVPFAPWVFIKPEAHGLLSKDLDYAYHDFYHAIVCSLIPKWHRQLIIEALDLFKGLPKEKFGDLRFRLRDMEHVFYISFLDKEYLYYLIKTPKNSDEGFWAGLCERLHFNLFPNDEARNEALTLLVKHFAIEQKGIGQGVSARGLMQFKDRVFAMPPSKAKDRCPIWEMVEIYETLNPGATFATPLLDEEKKEPPPLPKPPEAIEKLAMPGERADGVGAETRVSTAPLPLPCIEKPEVLPHTNKNLCTKKLFVIVAIALATIGLRAYFSNENSQL